MLIYNIATDYFRILAIYLQKSQIKISKGMKKLISLNLSLLIVFVFISSFGSQAKAQKRYTETDTINGITIMHKWQRSHIFKKDSRTILNLRLTNNNDYPVEITLKVGFYKTGVLVYTSEEHIKCFNPGQSKRGGRANLRFQSDELTIEDIESDNFDWGFVKFKVKQTELCP